MMQNKNGINCNLLKSSTQKDNLIKTISAASNKSGDKLLDFMDCYKLGRLNEASVKQLKEYVEKNKLKRGV